MNILKNKDSLINNHTFYRAVVEDRDDPKKLNRVRVRVMGMHSNDETKVKTNTLPWAELMPPIISGGQNSGFGLSSVPLNGTWVWVFFDAGDWNRPIVMGSMYGIPTKKSDKKAFSDPKGKYPLDDRLKESDVNRLSRNESFEKTIIETIKNKNIDSGISSVKATWDEPKETSSKAKYPDNTVIESFSGNFIEIDDTASNSRLHFFHKSGTYLEFKENGDFVEKATGHRFLIVNKNYNELVKGSKFSTVRGNYETKIDGSEDILTTGSRTETVSGSVKETYSSGQTTDGGPSIKIKAGIINLN